LGPIERTTHRPRLFAADVDWSDMAWGAFSAVAYAAVFGLLARRRFTTEDITG
jgi:ABC-2 type transport system permease protein